MVQYVQAVIILTAVGYISTIVFKTGNYVIKPNSIPYGASKPEPRAIETGSTIECATYCLAANLTCVGAIYTSSYKLCLLTCHTGYSGIADVPKISFLIKAPAYTAGANSLLFEIPGGLTVNRSIYVYGDTYSNFYRLYLNLWVGKAIRFQITARNDQNDFMVNITSIENHWSKQVAKVNNSPVTADMKFMVVIKRMAGEFKIIFNENIQYVAPDVIVNETIDSLVVDNFVYNGKKSYSLSNVCLV